MKPHVILGLLALACSVACAGEIAALYEKSPKSPPQNAHGSRHEAMARKHGVTEVGLERTTCYGTCPAYSVVIKSNGTVRYRGEHYVQRKGLRAGKIETWQFDELAHFIVDSGYMKLNTNYATLATDNSTVFTTVMMNGKRKVISNYANAGPTKLWAIEQLIDKLMLDTKWNEKTVSVPQASPPRIVSPRFSNLK